MNYSDGNQVKLGDRVRLGDDDNGVVVCSIDTNGFRLQYPESMKDLLKQGVMIEFPLYGVIHYTEPEPDLQLIARSSNAEID